MQDSQSNPGDLPTIEPIAQARSALDDIPAMMASAWGWLVDQGPAQAIALASFVGLFIALRLLRAVFCGALRSNRLPENSVRNTLSGLIGATHSLFLLLLAAMVVAPFVTAIPAQTRSILETAFMIALVIQGAIWIRRLVTSLTTGYLSAHDATEGGPGSTAATLIKTLSGIIIWALAAAMILTNLGYEIGPLIAGLGVGGLAIGLAAQSLFRDLFSALAIIFDKPFVRGDFITFDKGDYLGEVEKIGMKTTRLRALGGEQIIVSNAQLLDKEIRNYRRMARRRVSFEIGVVYATPHEALRQIPAMIESSVSAVEGATFDRSHFKSFGDSALVFETVYWIESRDYTDYMNRQQEILLNIHSAFEQAGLDFAFPTRTLHVVGETGVQV